MSSEIGNRIHVSIFGQSHGRAIGVLIDGLRAGEPIDEEELARFLQRRAPGRNDMSTKRSEPDAPIALSGLFEGRTCGAPLCAIIENTDTRSHDYTPEFPRPGHADWTAFVKYGGAADYRGGGHFSGRLTAPLCIAGGICRQILARRGITIGAHIAAVSDVHDTPFDPVKVSKTDLDAVTAKVFPVINDAAGEIMHEHILESAKSGDSVGGIVECCVTGLPAGLGEPIFGGVENRISAAVFGIPAVKGIEFGVGFGAAALHGSQNNDAYYYDENGVVRTRSNNCGGILGGITNGMPLIFRAAFKPTPSIALPQETIDLNTHENAVMSVHGRHDPCIVQRAVPCVEAAAAIVILDLMEEVR